VPLTVLKMFLDSTEELLFQLLGIFGLKFFFICLFFHLSEPQFLYLENGEEKLVERII